MTRCGCHKDLLVDFWSVLSGFKVFGKMDENLSAEKISPGPVKRRGKYYAAFGCNNSAYDANGIRTGYQFFEFPKDAH